MNYIHTLKKKDIQFYFVFECTIPCNRRLSSRLKLLMNSVFVVTVLGKVQYLIQVCKEEW